MRVTLLLILFPALCFCQKRNPGDTVVFQHFADSVTVQRLDTILPNGLVHSTSYFPSGKIYAVGCLRTHGGTYSERRQGYWITNDTSGRARMTESFNKGKRTSSSYYQNNLIDSNVRCGLHRYMYYRYSGEYLLSFRKSREQWLIPGIKRVIYNIGITSEWQSGDNVALKELNYDTTGKLVFSARYFRGREYQVMTASDNLITYKKYNLHHDLKKLVQKDSNGVIVLKENWRNSENAYDFKRQKKYNGNGKLVSYYRRYRRGSKYISYYENGHIKSKRVNRMVGRNVTRYEDGKIQSRSIEFTVFHKHHYKGKHWDKETRKKTISHSPPSRNPW